MLEIPPRVNSAFTSAFFVWATKPVSTKLANCLIVKCGSLIKIITVETKILINKVGIAGILHHAQTNIKMIGKLAHQLIVKCCSKILIVSLTRVISGALLACPSAKKPIKEIKKYAALRAKGDATFSERMEMLMQHRQSLDERIRQLQEHEAMLDEKIAFYRQEIECRREGEP